MTSRHRGLETPDTRTSCTRHGPLFAEGSQTVGEIRDEYNPVEIFKSIVSNTLINKNSSNSNNTNDCHFSSSSQKPSPYVNRDIPVPPSPFFMSTISEASRSIVTAPRDIIAVRNSTIDRTIVVPERRATIDTVNVERLGTGQLIRPFSGQLQHLLVWYASRFDPKLYFDQAQLTQSMVTWVTGLPADVSSNIAAYCTTGTAIFSSRWRNSYALFRAVRARNQDFSVRPVPDRRILPEPDDSPVDYTLRCDVRMGAADSRYGYTFHGIQIRIQDSHVRYTVPDKQRLDSQQLMIVRCQVRALFSLRFSRPITLTLTIQDCLPDDSARNDCTFATLRYIFGDARIRRRIPGCGQLTLADAYEQNQDILPVVQLNWGVTPVYLANSSDSPVVHRGTCFVSPNALCFGQFVGVDGAGHCLAVQYTTNTPADLQELVQAFGAAGWDCIDVPTLSASTRQVAELDNLDSIFTGPNPPATTASKPSSTPQAPPVGPSIPTVDMLKPSAPITNDDLPYCACVCRYDNAFFGPRLHRNAMDLCDRFLARTCYRHRFKIGVGLAAFAFIANASFRGLTSMMVSTVLRLLVKTRNFSFPFLASVSYTTASVVLRMRPYIEYNVPLLLPVPELVFADDMYDDYRAIQKKEAHNIFAAQAQLALLLSEHNASRACIGYSLGENILHPTRSVTAFSDVSIPRFDGRGHVFVPITLYNESQIFLRDHPTPCPDAKWINMLQKYLIEKSKIVVSHDGKSRSVVHTAEFTCILDSLLHHVSDTMALQIYQRSRRLRPSLRRRWYLWLRYQSPIAWLCDLFEDITMKSFVPDYGLARVCPSVFVAEPIPDVTPPIADDSDVTGGVPETSKRLPHRKCFICGSTTHVRKDCPKTRSGGPLVATVRRFKCYACGKYGHIATECNSFESRGGAPVTRQPEPDDITCRKCGVTTVDSKCWYCMGGPVWLYTCHTLTPVPSPESVCLPAYFSVKPYSLQHFGPNRPVDPSWQITIGSGSDKPRRRGPIAYLPFSSRRFPSSIDGSHESLVVALLNRQCRLVENKELPDVWMDTEITQSLVMFDNFQLTRTEYLNRYPTARRVKLEAAYQVGDDEHWSRTEREFTRFRAFPKFELSSKPTSLYGDGLRFKMPGPGPWTSVKAPNGSYNLCSETDSSIPLGRGDRVGVVIDPRNISHQGSELNIYWGRSTQSLYVSLHESWTVTRALQYMMVDCSDLQFAQTEGHFDPPRRRRVLQPPNHAIVLGSGRNNIATGSIFRALLKLESMGFVVGESDYTMFDSTQREGSQKFMRRWARLSGVGWSWIRIHKWHTQAQTSTRYRDKIKGGQCLYSGVPTTTLQGSVVNAYAVLYNAKQTCGPDYRRQVFAAVAGDDLIAAVSPRYAQSFWSRFAISCAELGLTAKVKVRQVRDATFLASQYWPTSSGETVAAPELARCLYKAPWALEYQSDPEAWRNGVLMGLRHILSPVPIFSQWLRDACKGIRNPVPVPINEQWRGNTYFASSDAMELLIHRYPTLQFCNLLNPFIGPYRVLASDSPIDAVLIDGGYDHCGDP